jgi:hypothetical protein
MAKTPAEIRSLARGHTVAAINCLAGIMNKETAPEAARISAATALLDRGWGKPTQPISGDEDGPPIQFTRIELIGVRPTDQDS